MTNRKEAFTIRLNRDAYNMIMRQPASLKLEIGPDSSFMIIGDRPFDINLRKEGSTVQVYEKDKKAKLEGSNRIHYVSDITHVGHMKQVLSEEDKKRIRSRTEQIQKEKDSRRIGLLDVPPTGNTTNNNNNNNINGHKKYMSPSHTSSNTSSSPLSTTTTTNTKKNNNLISPSLTPTANPTSSTLSPRISSPAPTSTPPVHTVPRLEGAALLNLRERLIHLLAIDPRPADQLIQMLKVANTDLLPLLKKVAVNKNSNWCLRPEIFKEIRIWDWNRYDDKERAIVRKKAEEAYNHLNYPRNAPERNNLIQRKAHRGSPKLIPPPSQHHHTAPTTPNASSSPSNLHRKHESSVTPNGRHHQPPQHSSPLHSSLTPNNNHHHSSTTPNNKPSRNNDHFEDLLNHHNTNNNNNKLSSSLSSPSSITKKRKIEKTEKTDKTEKIKPTNITSKSINKYTESKPSIKQTNNNHSTVNNNNNNHSSTASIHSHSPVTPIVSNKSTSNINNDEKYIKKPKKSSQPIQNNHYDISTSSSNDDLSLEEEEIDEGEIYIPPPIRTQMDFDTLCKNHQEIQKDYIRFKKTFIKNHPIYIEGLSVINEKDKTLFIRKLKSYYKAKGGDMNKWRLLMRLSRQFNGTHTKINIMWNTIEKAYKKHKFSLHIKKNNISNHRQTSSTSSYSSQSSSSSKRSR